MSIILDALRKSEAARRRNQAPELFAEMRERAPAPRAQTRLPTWVLVGIPGLGIGALAVALLLMTRGTDTTDSTTAAATNDAEVAAASATNSSSANSSSAGPSSAGPSGAGSSSTTADVVASIETPVPTPAAPPDVAIASAPTPPVQNAARASDTMPNPPPVAPQVATPSIATTPKPAAAQDTTAATPSPTPVEPSQPPAFRSPGNDAPMALGDLDTETRKQLPPLKLSMHMWHDTAAQRFVILDGQRLREGDVIGDVVVQRITRDGATLSWRGTALKVEWR